MTTDTVVLQVLCRPFYFMTSMAKDELKHVEPGGVAAQD